MDFAVSEMIFAGNVVGRRAASQAGSGLTKGPKGEVDAGIGKSASNGSVTLIPPTDIISGTGSKMIIDGVEMVFQNTPDTEAPAEFNFYLPQFKALCMAENCTHTAQSLHVNIIRLVLDGGTRNRTCERENLIEGTTLAKNVY